MDWLTIDDVVLTHPAFVRFANVDAKLRKLLTPTPHYRFHVAEPFDVVLMCSMLADFKLALSINENLGQLWESVQEESIGDQHQFTVVPVLPCQLNVRQDRRIEQRFTAKQCESRWLSRGDHCKYSESASATVGNLPAK